MSKSVRFMAHYKKFLSFVPFIENLLHYSLTFINGIVEGFWYNLGWVSQDNKTFFDFFPDY